MKFWYFYATFYCVLDSKNASYLSSAHGFPRSDLWINTTYQAEDLGIHYQSLPQCKAWNLWWDLQHGKVTPTNEIIDLLSSRKNVVSLNSVMHHFGINLSRICDSYKAELKISENGTNNTKEKRKNAKSLTSLHNNLKFNSKKSEGKDPNIAFVTKYKSVDNLQRVDGSFLLQSGKRIVNPEVKIAYQVVVDYDAKASNVVFSDPKIAHFFELGELTEIFQLHKGIKIDLENVCTSKEDFVSKNSEEQTVVELKKNRKMNLNENNTTSKLFLEYGIQLSNILTLFDNEELIKQTPYSSSKLKPILDRNRYDSRSPPINCNDNFTEDYDMDLWLRMTWRDLRLVHELDRPILINDENFLKKIWLPAPFFQNAKEAKYHRMTLLNFWMYIFPGGEVFLETHLYLKLSCKLILCKYPHDNQVCTLKISDIALDSNSVRYIWFPRLRDAIRMNEKLELGELYIQQYHTQNCIGKRKTGDFSCLEAQWKLKRHLSYHFTRTYIPTAICVLFSWISVWLPEEFVTGRIFSSLTLFLTLSTENSAMKEVLPKVSYMKAIDIWFGFTASFVFITMLESIVVISLEYKSRQLHKKAENHSNFISHYHIMILLANYYQTVARQIDKYSRTLYPAIFLLFLIIYYFVIIEGDEMKCIQQSGNSTL
ncbi:unnamed protein product [Thelazia callipaeda]|uniref:Neur_chan_LBD domain-containing protein n=1 Tax=Thelazia callipaeda TaxID=103827 RepID=A0A0N5D2B8_THECL|nr:unnamed protein product [Thelazia callipaeda]